MHVHFEGSCWRCCVALVDIRNIFLRIAAFLASHGSSNSRALERPDADENHDGEDPVALQ